MDESNEEKWIEDQRALVEKYLRQQGVDHLGVGDYPAFHVHPYLALWAVQSKKAPGQVGWWCCSGDLPTDCISSRDGRHPREALRAFSRNWKELSACMIRGEPHPDFSIGTPDLWPELGPLLKARAEVLRQYADDDSLWSTIT